MNIFYTNACPIMAAWDHNNVHNNKMLTESIQILSTVKRLVEGIKCKVLVRNKNGELKSRDWYLLDSDTVIDGVLVSYEIYAATHATGPFVKWAMASRANYEWLWMLAAELSCIYEKHKGVQQAAAYRLYDLADVPVLPELPHTPVPMAKSASDNAKATYVTDAVRGHIVAMLEKLHEWRTRPKPQVYFFYKQPTWVI